MVKELSLRRVPQQMRGQQRIATILDAAEQIFADIGYEAATTNAIAARAQTSIGSLYQFFPNKEEILHAVAARYLEQLRSLFDTVLTHDAAFLPLPVFLDRIIGALAELHTEHSGFRPLFFGSQTSKELAAAAEQLRQEVMQRIEHLLAVRVPALKELQRHLYAQISVEVVRALMPLVTTSDTDYRARVIAELKAMLLAYLGPIVDRDF